MAYSKTIPDDTDPAADARGARRFTSHMSLDERGMAMLSTWFEQSLSVELTPANKFCQLRGLDLCVRLRGVRGAKLVGIDLKADNTQTGNISIELISQDRPNFKHAEPVPGWSAKDMPLVAQLFMQTGDMVVINMTLFYPWLFPQIKAIVDGRSSKFELPHAWLSATPNERYNSHNLIVPIEVLLGEAPGCLYLRARDVLAQEKYAMLLKGGKFPKPLMVTRPYDAEAALSTLQGWLGALKGYDIKPQLTAVDKERLLRFLEPRAKFSKAKPEVEMLGRQHIASRPRLALPEDEVALSR